MFSFFKQDPVEGRGLAVLERIGARRADSTLEGKFSTRREHVFVLALVSFSCLVSLPVAAQRAALKASNIPAAGTGEVEESGAPRRPEAYGTADLTYLWLPAATFVPRDTSSIWQDIDFGRVQLVTAGTGTHNQDLMAPVNLPAGALVDGIRYYWCDADTVNQITATFTTYPATCSPKTDPPGM